MRPVSGILVTNSGSSSLKFALFDAGGAGHPLVLHGQIGGLGQRTQIDLFGEDGAAVAVTQPSCALDHDAAVDWLLGLLAQHAEIELAAAGHRVVHGGSRHTQPVAIDDEVLTYLESLCPLAPLHQPHNLAAIEALRRLCPTLPQVACFDTAFHATQPAVARTFALPRALSESGILRYGFHGLSYEYIARVLPAHLGPRADGAVIVAHLGNGASLCAMRRRRSVASTMGFSALDGLMMGTRSGSIDPGVVMYLMDHLGMDVRAVEDLLYRRSGLLGVSGESSDMRALLASASAHAAEAIELFCYRAIREIGSLAAALDGLDALVFTGGIGEHAAPVRARIVAGLGWLGAALDRAANEGGGTHIDATASRVALCVIPTDEERMIATHTTAVVGL
jgi:acetate kinase